MSKTDESCPESQTHNNVTLAHNIPTLLLTLAQKGKGLKDSCGWITSKKNFCGNFMDMILEMVLKKIKKRFRNLEQRKL